MLRLLCVRAEKQRIAGAKRPGRGRPSQTKQLPCTEPEQMVSGSQRLRGLVANRKSQGLLKF